MTLLSPLILTLLVPWALFALWVFIGRRPRVNVSFLRLWDAPEELRRPKNKAFQPPPLAVVLAILSLLMLILAAARPALRSRGERIATLIVDRGATMSALGPAGRPRYVESADALAQALIALDPPVRLRVIAIPAPGGDALHPDAALISPTELVALIAKLPRTAADTSLELKAAAQRSHPGQVFILSDRDVGPVDPARLISIPPPPAAADVGIVALAARDGQIMLTLAATAAARRTLRLTTGDKSTDTPVSIEPDQPRTLFIPLAAPGPTIQATLLSELDSPDALEANDTAWLVRQRSWAAVEQRTPLPEEVRRLLTVYRRHRPADPGAPVVAVARLSPGAQSPRSTEPAILLADVILQPRTHSGEIRAEPHAALAAGIDWSPWSQNLTIAPAPGADWKPILTLSAAGVTHPLIAIRETAGARQAWVGFDSASLAQSPAFVILWSSLLDWVATAPAAGAEEYQASVLGSPSSSTSPLNESVAPESSNNARRLSPLPPDADPRHWPGLFESRASGDFALNAPALLFPPVNPNDWRSRLTFLSARADTDLASPLCLLSLLLLTASAATWERRRLPAITRVSHVDAETRERVETTFEADGHAHHHTRRISPK